MTSEFRNAVDMNCIYINIISEQGSHSTSKLSEWKETEPAVRFLASAPQETLASTSDTRYIP